MKQARRWAALLLALVLLAGLTACGEKKTEDDTQPSTAPQTAPSAAPEATQPTEPPETEDPALAAAVGTWTGLYTKLAGDSDDAKRTEPFSLELKDDGTGIHRRDDNAYDVTWTLEGETFTMSEYGIVNYTGTLKDGRLELLNGAADDIWAMQYVYEKKSQE